MRRTILVFGALCSGLSGSARSDADRVFVFTPQGNAVDHPVYSRDREFGFEQGASNRFSVRVPEGNYRVTVRWLGDQRLPRTTILSEQRRLGALQHRVLSGQTLEGVLVVNVRSPWLDPLPANAPGGIQVRLNPREVGAANWDDRLTIEFLPPPATLLSIAVAPTDVPTLYLAGDSTVADQPVAPNASWGQKLPAFFGPDLAVANHAESGETLKSFVTGLRLDKLLSRLRAGDWVMIQFGHNDQKHSWPQTFVEATTTYRAWLRAYLAEIRRRGATPLLVTSPERRNFDDRGRIVASLGDYPDSMRAVAREEHVALLDLNLASIRLYERLGPEEASRAFAEEGRDRTHFNDHGALLLAREVIEVLRAADPALTGGLEKHVTEEHWMMEEMK